MMRLWGLSFFLMGLAGVVFGLLVIYDVYRPPWFDGGLDDGRQSVDDAGIQGDFDEDDDDHHEDKDDDHEDDDRVFESEYEVGVYLSPAAQAMSGLRVETLSEIAFRPEIKAFGRVVDIEPMVSLRLRYDKARLAGSKALSENIRIHTELAWGRVLAAELLDEKSRFLESVARGREVLIQVTLPLSETLEKGADAHLYRNRETSRPIVAKYVSPAPRVDPAIQGETHFYRATTQQLRTGMAVDVAVIPSTEPLSGIFVPETAVIWRDGQAWIYVQTTAENFERMVLSTDYKAVGGWFTQRPDWAGMDVVVVGAQVLLSEEFRTHLGDDDDD